MESGASGLTDLLGQTTGGYRIERILSAGATTAMFGGRRIAPDPMAGAAADPAASTLPDEAIITLFNAPWPLDATGRAIIQSGLQREVALLRGLGGFANPYHLVPVLAAGEANGVPYLVLPAMAGGLLTAMLGAGSQPLTQVAGYLAQLAAALDALHRQGAVHGDINPSNVLLDSAGQVHLANAGIIPLLQSTAPAGTGQLLGTPVYSAPERFAGYPTSAASDIYSLGVLLYQLVTGQPPFYSADFAELARQQQTQPPAPPQALRPDLPPFAAAAMLQALVKQPAQRFASAGALAHAFAAGLAAPVAVAPLPPAMPPAMPYPAPPARPPASAWPQTAGTMERSRAAAAVPAPAAPAPARRGGAGWVIAAIAGVVVVSLLVVLVGRQVLPMLTHGKGSTGTGLSPRVLPTATPNLAASQVFKYNLATGGSGDIVTLDPDITIDLNSTTVEYLIYDGLVELNQNLGVENWGAKNVDISSNGLTYTFHLQPNQKFANGTPVTSKDYAYSLNRTLNPCLASPASYYLFELKDAETFANEACHGGRITTLIGDSINTPDDLTLELTLAQPAAYFLEALTYPTSWALDPNVVGSDPTSESWLNQLADGAGTSGMYQVRTWDHTQGIIDLVPNPNWWGLAAGKKPYLTEIDFTLFKDSDTAYSAYQSGQFDVGFPTSQFLAQAKAQPDFHASGTLSYEGINFNWTKAPFTNQDARVAACLAINRDALNTNVLNGTVIPHWNIVPKGMPGYNPNVTGPDGVTSTAGDTTKAAAHWATYKAAAGAAAANGWTYLYINSGTTQLRLAQALQAQWQQALGVTVTLKGVNVQTWVQALSNGNYITTRFGWLDDYPDPQDFLSLLFSANAVYNGQHASVPQADSLMAAADANNDQTQRFQNYNQAEQDLINAVATCPLYQGQNFYQVRSCVHNWVQNASVTTPLDSWMNTYIDPSCPNT